MAAGPGRLPGRVPVRFRVAGRVLLPEIPFRDANDARST